MIKRRKFHWILSAMAALLMVSTGCGEATDTEEPNTEDIDYSEFRPFDEQNMTNQIARLESHAEIVTLRKTATTENAAEVYGQIEDLYEAHSLNQKVAGRTDDHLDTVGWGHENVGEFWDGQITNAIAMGAAGATEADVAWAGQVIDKGLQVFFYYSVYHELYLKKRKNFDEAYGYFGLNFDGTPRDAAPLANNAVAREAEYGLTLVTPIFNSFIEARYALANGTASNDDVLGEDAEYDAAMANIDRLMLSALGHYALHEVDVLTEENADIKIIEARVIWDALAPYAESVDADAAQAVLDGLYPDGMVERDDANYFYTGLSEIRDGSTTIDTAALRNAMLDILETLE